MAKLSIVPGEADLSDAATKKIAKALIGNNRALGFVATALKTTQESKEGETESFDKFAFQLEGGPDKEERMAQAGIKGEQDLFDYLRLILNKFPTAVIIPSITMEDQDKSLEEKGYIPDIDFVVIVGKAMLILDSKVMPPAIEIPYSIRDSNIVMATKIIREIHPSQYYLRKWSEIHKHPLKQLSEWVIIMNNRKTLVYKSPAWHRSPWKLYHVGELLEALQEFYTANNDDKFYLDYIVDLYQFHVTAEKSFEDEDKIRSIFKI